MSSIEWTSETWNPVLGCSRVSAGCEHCYAETFVHRGLTEAHRGLTVLGKHGPRWKGTVRFLPERLETPLRWKKPRRVFVNSMSDLFHEALSNEQIAAVFGVMAACPQHMFQVLTKRAKRMREWFAWIADRASGGMPAEIDVRGYACYVLSRLSPHGLLPIGIDSGLNRTPVEPRWPLPNVHLGVSCEDQATAAERIPDLLACPAAVRWVSYEPALAAVDFGHLDVEAAGSHPEWCVIDALTGRHRDMGRPCPDVPHLDWIVVGGESGPRARPFDLAWARSVITQCRTANCPAFVKQLGGAPYERAEAFGPGAAGYDPSNILEAGSRPRPPQMDGWTRVTTAEESAFYRYPRFADRKGGDWSEWPADLRVRMWPGEAWT